MHIGHDNVRSSSFVIAAVIFANVLLVLSKLCFGWSLEFVLLVYLSHCVFIALDGIARTVVWALHNRKDRSNWAWVLMSGPAVLITIFGVMPFTGMIRAAANPEKEFQSLTGDPVVWLRDSFLTTPSLWFGVSTYAALHLLLFAQAVIRGAGMPSFNPARAAQVSFLHVLVLFAIYLVTTKVLLPIGVADSGWFVLLAKSAFDVAWLVILGRLAVRRAPMRDGHSDDYSPE